MNYVLQYKGPDRPTSEEVERVRSVDGVCVVDESAFSLLAEIAPETLGKIAALLPDWEVSPEVTYSPPTTRKSVEDQD